MTQRRRRSVDVDEGAAAAAHASTPPLSKRPRTEKDGEEEEEATKQFWMESDASSLVCAICLMPFEAEIYMCTNGHAACGRCCLRINRKCWCCDEPIGDVRCRPLESLLGDLSTPCKFRKYGCGESVRYTERRAHEESCPRAPLGCPLDCCTYRGLLLYEHVVDDHEDAFATISYLRTTTVTLRKAAPFRVLVQPGRARRVVYLLLNGGHVLGGRCLSVCLGPRPEGNAEIDYKMEVRAVRATRGRVPGEEVSLRTGR